VIRDIAGRQNHSVKLAHKLQKKKHRRERGLLVGEGMDLLRAAVEAGADVREVLVRRDLLSQLPAGLAERAAAEIGSSLDIGICDAETLDYVSSLGGAADVIFTCKEPEWGLADIALGEGVTFFLDGVGDPGNVGTLVRSAVAFGLAGVLCSPGTADVYGPKAMRAGMGAQFLLPVVTEVSADDVRARLAGVAGRGGRVPEVWLAVAHGGDDMRTLRTEGGVLVVLGGERLGVESEWAGARGVTISQERFDSLNVAMAGTILAYELRARRGGGCGK
jgi:TrmH family RNA methyltransferase